MTTDRRQIGGESGKRGSRYEDFFAVYRLIEFARKHIANGSNVRLREQVKCPVDDLLLQEPSADHYHQLKSGAKITWGQDSGKLEEEFLAQRRLCEELGNPFRLWIVVASSDRHESLTDNMPEDLAEVTSVFLFPILKRPSDLALCKELIGDHLVKICASRYPSVSEHQHIVRAFFTGWIEHEPDADGYCDLAWIIAKIREWRIARICCSWDTKSNSWRETEELLKSIPGLKFWVDRGYFEWEYAPAERGLFRDPCDSEQFTRFVDRVLDAKPETFEDFERLLP